MHLTHDQAHGRARQLTLQYYRVLLSHNRALFYFASLGSLSFGEPLFFMEFILKAFFYINTIGFLRKISQTNL